jgi:Flp pilus assembly protein TadD
MDPDDRRLRQDKATALADLGRFEEALQWFDRALQISPQDADLLRMRGAVVARLTATDPEAAGRG